MSSTINNNCSTSSTSSSSQNTQSQNAELENAQKIIEELGCKLSDSRGKLIRNAVATHNSQTLKVTLAFCKSQGKDCLPAILKEDRFGNSPLIDAAKSDNPDLLLELLPYLHRLPSEKLAEIMTLNTGWGQREPSALAYALRSGSVNCIKELTKLLPTEILEKQAPLLCDWAAANKDPACLELLFKLMPESVHRQVLSTTYNGRATNNLCMKKTSLLHVATYLGNVEAVRFLVPLYQKYGLRPLCEVTKDKETVFHLAAAEGLPELIEVLEPLIDKKALKTALEPAGDDQLSSLVEAAVRGDLEFCKALIDLLERYEIDGIMQPNFHRLTPLHFAVKSGSAPCIRFFMDFSKKVGVEIYKRPLLSMAAGKDNCESLQLVLDFLGDDFKTAVEFVDDCGYTPIQIAARGGHTEVLLTIASRLNDEDLNRLMNFGKQETPMQMMLRHHPEAIVPVYTKLLPRLSEELQIATLAGDYAKANPLLDLIKDKKLSAPMIELFSKFCPEARVKALKRRGNVMYEVISKGNLAQAKLLFSLFGSLDPKTRAPLIKASSDRNLLYIAIETFSRGKADMISLLANVLSPEEICTLLENHTVSASLVRRPELIAKLDLLLKRLNPQQRLQVLRIKKGTDSLLHIATKERGSSALLSIMQPKEIEAAMIPGRGGNTPLHLAETESDVKALCAWARKNQPKLLLTRNDREQSPLITTASYPKAFAVLMDTLTDQELLQSMEPDEEGSSPLHELASNDGILGLLKTLRKRLGREAFARAMKADIHGNNPLLLAFGGVSPDCLRFLISKLSKSELIEAFRPNNSGLSVLSKSTRTPSLFEYGAKIALKLGAKTAQELTEADAAGNTLFHQLSAFYYSGYSDPNQSEPVGYKLCCELYRKAGKDPEKAVLTPNSDGKLPLQLLASRYCQKRYKELLDVFGPRVLSRSLLIPEQRSSPIEAISRGLKSAISLLDELKSDWQLAKALGSRMIPKSILEYLIHRYPKAEDVARVLMLAKLYHNQLSELYCSGMERKLQGGLKAAWTAHIKGNSAPMKGVYPTLLDALADKKNRIQKAIKDTEDKDKKEVLEGLLEKLEKWQAQVCIALAIGGSQDAQLGIFHPLLQRLQNLASIETRLALTQLLALYPLTDERTVEQVKPWLKACTSRNKPGLHLIALSALLQRGVRPEIVRGLHLKIMKEGRDLREGCTAGKALLRNLASLASATELTSQDLNHVLMLTLHGDLSLELSAIGQIIQLGAVRELRSERLRGRIANLQAISFKLFQELIPVGDVEDFHNAYEQKIGTQRDPNSLITYASKQRGNVPTRKDLGRFLTWVLTDEFHRRRYAKDNSPHMEALYAAMPILVTELPKLAKGMGTELLSELGAEKDGISFPMDRKIIRLKLLDDGHLQEDAFPHIFAFLRATKQEELQGVDKALENAKAKLKQSGGSELAKLQLQECLIALCRYSDVLDTETNGKQLTKIQKLMAGQLKELVRLSKALGGVLGQFSEDITGAQDTYNNSQKRAPADFVISVSDDYWDLLRIGTDVNGSCQSLYTSADHNKCLLDFVMHGKNFAIVARKPGSKDIAARRMLRIEIDSSTRKPALYLERFYGNYRNWSLDDGLCIMAKKVAQRLKLPLYCSDTGEYHVDDHVQLLAKESAVEWSYSDAAKGQFNRGYQFRPQRCMVKGPEQQSSSSSSSSSK